MVTDTIDDKYLVGYKSLDFKQKDFLAICIWFSVEILIYGHELL